jgi:hypothetical protein
MSRHETDDGPDPFIDIKQLHLSNARRWLGIKLLLITNSKGREESTAMGKSTVTSNDTHPIG